MSLKFTLTTLALLAISNLCICTQAQCAEKKNKKEIKTEGLIKVGSLEELQPYLTKSDVNVVMTPGTYRITPKLARTGKISATSEVVEGRISHALVLVAGNNSTFDFTGVTLEVETAVFGAFPGKYSDFNELHITGSNNVVKNLKLVDVGSPLDFPKYGCVNVIVDGENNLVEGVEIRSTGSKPYGYGELFGKGGRNNTIGHKKHSALLVRGYKSHIKGCKIYHRAYGHCLFMQAADHPTIEGCYIEGEMSTTDKVLAEAGTGSEADKIGFMTTWGYKVPSGHAIALCEEGIRAYNGGNTIINGERFKRGTSNVTIKDCYVKNARAGVTLTHAKGFKYVENCTTVGCNRGYAVGTNGKIVNCFADTQNGPAFGVDYPSDSRIEADITLLPYEGKNQNGTEHAAIIIGKNHNIILRKGKGLKEDQKLKINIGGDNKTIGLLAKDENYLATGIKIINETNYPIVVDNTATNNSGTSVGKIIDLGYENTITKK